jgi:hypothetical protein
MQEKARSGKGTSIEDLFSEDSTGVTDDETMGEGTDDDHIFPDTDRMKKVLQSQGYTSEPSPGTVAPQEETDAEAGYSVEKDTAFERAAPASLLEFFTDREKEELRLESYDGEE